MLTDKKGFTLVELIVVIAIIGIVAGLIGVSTSSVSSARARQCSESIDTLISKCRIDCLSRAGEFKLIISIDGDGNVVANYYKNGTLVKTDTFSGKGFAVKYTKNLLGAETEVALEGNPLTLSFDRGTGSQKYQSDGTCYTSISFISSHTFKIELVPSTGSHKLA